MAKDVRVRLNLKGLNKLMTSQPAMAEVMRRANRIRNAAGDGYIVQASPHKWTAGAVVKAGDPETARKEARTQRLLRSIDAGR